MNHDDVRTSLSFEAPRRAFSLLLGRSNLARGVALVESILEQEDDEVSIFALCLDDETVSALGSVRIPQLEAISIARLAPRASGTMEVLRELISERRDVDVIVHMPSERQLVGSVGRLLPGEAALEVIQPLGGGGLDAALVVVRRERGAEEALTAWISAERSADDVDVADIPGVLVRSDGAASFSLDFFVPDDLAFVDDLATYEGRSIISVDFLGLRMFSPELFALATDPERLLPTMALESLLAPYLDSLARAATWERGATGSLAGNADPATLSASDELFAVRGLRARLEAHGLGRRRVEFGPVWDGYLAEARGSVSLVRPKLARRPPCPKTVPLATSVTATEPRVTALVSTYHAEHVFRGCMDDLVAQTLFERGELEIVVVDSASPTPELAIALDYAKRFPNIVVVRTERREGVYMAWNRAASLARGKYLTNANTDDRHRTDALELMADALDRSPEVGLVYADADITRTPNATFGQAPLVGRFRWPEFERARLIRGCHIGPQPMWRRELHDIAGWFDGRYVVAGDYDMWLRFAEHTPMQHLSVTLGLYHHRDDSIEHSNAERCGRETSSLWASYQLRFDGGGPPNVSAKEPPIAAETRPVEPANALDGATATATSYSCSIVVVLPDDLEASRRCIKALVSNTPGYIPYEVIFPLRGELVAVRPVLEPLSGDVVCPQLRADASLLEGWQAAAEVAKSEVLVLVDGNVCVSEGWLDPILRTLEREEGLGAAVGRHVTFGASTATSARYRVGAVAVGRNAVREVSTPHVPKASAREYGDAAKQLFRHLDASGLGVVREPRSSVVGREARTGGDLACA